MAVKFNGGVAIAADNLGMFTTNLDCNYCLT